MLTSISRISELKYKIQYKLQNTCILVCSNSTMSHKILIMYALFIAIRIQFNFKITSLCMKLEALVKLSSSLGSRLVVIFVETYGN